MKISGIETLALNVAPINNWSFIRITTDEGLQGIGEMTLNAWEPMQRAFVDMLTPTLLGRTVETAIDRLKVYPHCQGGQAASSVFSATEQALCDILARSAGKPLYEWLGQPQRRKVRVYANIDRRTRDRSPASFAANSKTEVNNGYQAVKITPFDGVMPGRSAAENKTFIEAGLERVYAVREAIGPEVDLLVDCHWRFNEAGAHELLRELETARLFWVECIVSENPEHRGALRRLRKSAQKHGIRLAGAERQLGLSGFTPFIEDDLLDVVMPDVKYAGGCRELVRIAEKAARHQVAFSPHNPCSPVCSLASMHVCAVTEDALILEHQIPENEVYAHVVNEPLPRLVDGCWELPDRPGLGVTLNDAVIEARPFVPMTLDGRMDLSLG
ncbi:dehydratase [Agaricicola taiwanensis]|uniref:glucarate dehydratase n=1 Tax=Agaricicola taiwanensis TaxID=591372 RepID=A0A8J2VLK1_9RHOB|nr:mandelate racemase/muconate lactonizing enzyme family protein [Agaricicola taiwanensis]GGE36632.1 dehydratase [Agaricicola taiwanensis]